MPNVYLLTGRPGTGKTSLIKQLTAEFNGIAGGFYTEEMRAGGVRLGFRLITLDGRSAVLAHVGFDKSFRVGKYGVDVGSLERVGVVALEEAIKGCNLVILDEIGKMELFSARFRSAVSDAIASGKKVVGTIMLDSHPFADQVKAMPQVSLISLTRSNYQEALEGLRGWLAQ